MDHAAGARSADEHWAPDRLVLGSRTLVHAGLLVVARDETGAVATHEPLEGMAALEHRYPYWARGPFGEIDPERDLPSAPGVYALVQAGVVHYVGASRNLGRSFGPRGVGEVTREEATRRASEEKCRINRLIVAAAVDGHVVDLYVLPLARWWPWRRDVERPVDVAGEILTHHRGAWHLPR